MSIKEKEEWFLKIQQERIELGKWSNVKDLTGQKINNLLVLREYGRTKYQQVKWLCQCDCGNETIVVSNNLLNGNTKSCGCNRSINQKKGFEWESLVKKVLSYKFNNLSYHEYLPNGTIPDFYLKDQKIILDAKRHDFLEIEECIDKYGPYCEKLIFVCMKRKRENYRLDFPLEKIEFWYPNDILTWLPEEQHEDFLKKVEKIENLWIKTKSKKKKLTLQETIKTLEREDKKVTKTNIAKKLGFDKRNLRNDEGFEEIFTNYNKDLELKKLNDLVKKVLEAISNIEEHEGRVSFQNVARIMIERNSINGSETPAPIDEQLLWRVTKQISTNDRIKEILEGKLKEKDQMMKEKIIESIKILKGQKEKVTIQDIKKYTKIPKNYVYSEEIKRLIENEIQKYDENHQTINKKFRCKITLQEVERTIKDLTEQKKNISKRKIERQLHCDIKAINTDKKIKEFVESEIRLQEQGRRQSIIEAIEEIIENESNLSIEAVAVKTGLSKRFIRKEENKILIEREITRLENIKKQKVIATVLELKKLGQEVTFEKIKHHTRVSRKYLEKKEIRELIQATIEEEKNKITKFQEGNHSIKQSLKT